MDLNTDGWEKLDVLAVSLREKGVDLNKPSMLLPVIRLSVSLREKGVDLNIETIKKYGKYIGLPS